MRNGNKTRQLLSLARIFVLALCFTLVFAAALIVSDDVIADNNSNNIANAITVDSGGCVPYDLGINASSFSYSTTLNGWVFERSLTNINLSTDEATGSVSVYKPQD